MFPFWDIDVALRSTRRTAMVTMRMTYPTWAVGRVIGAVET